MTDWYVLRGNEGVSTNLGTLQQWIRAKKLTRLDLVCKTGDQIWKPASEFSELDAVFAQEDSAASSDLGTFIGCLFPIFGIAAVVWGAYSCFYAPARKASPTEMGEHQHIAHDVERLQEEMQRQFGAIDPRIEVRKAGNVHVYITSEEFQSVPYPDRAEAVSVVGRVWCRNVEHIFMPTVRLRDISTGRVLGSFNCVTARGRTWQ